MISIQVFAFGVVLLELLSGKPAVVFFYGADDAPSCSKQIMAMDQALPEFQSMGVKVVGGEQPAATCTH